jgi:hypothetical protein
MSYITFKTLGEAGDLGSQMQQYASLYAIAKASGKDIIFPESSVSRGYGFKFANLVELPINTQPDEFFRHFTDVRPDDSVLVDKAMFNLNNSTNYNVINRFDLFKYWYESCKDDIMQWPWNRDREAQAQIAFQKLPQDKELVAIHVRRGDYLLPQHNHFCRLDVDYYGKALEPYIAELENYHFVIFSNDIEWCKDNLIEGDMVTFIEPGNDCEDLILMSLCNHFIIANSSYSWWAAFKSKSPNKKVTCPTNYLNSFSAWAHVNSNYYPPTWINIDNAN